MKTQYKRFIAFWLVLFVITCATLASSSATQANYSGNSGDIASNQPQATTDDSLKNYVVLPETLPCVTAGEKPIAEATIAERDAKPSGKFGVSGYHHRCAGSA